jgi:hypothetical protein
MRWVDKIVSEFLKFNENMGYFLRFEFFASIME